jgi:tripartite-type tricarboxylate transporter receptor subunit TctC
MTAALLWAVAANAAFPDKPVTIVTAMPAGSGPDVVMRQMAEKLSAKWKVPVIIDNKPGGAGAVMFNAYADTPADGYTVAIADPGVFVAYPILYNKPEVLTNIQPLAGTFITSFVLATSPSITSLADLKTKLKANPTFATSAVGTGMHLEGLEFDSYLGIDAKHIPYKELGASFVDTSTGTVTYTFTTIASSRQLESSGKLRYLAVAAEHRNPAYPNVPTLAELTGKPLTLYHSWNIVYIKKAVPADVKEKIAKDISEIMATPEMVEKVKSVGYETLPGTPADLEKFVNAETVNFKRSVKKYNISIN